MNTKTNTFNQLRETATALGGRRLARVFVPKHNINKLEPRKKQLDFLRKLGQDAKLPLIAMGMATRHSTHDDIQLNIVFCVRKGKAIWQAAAVTTTSGMLIETQILEKKKRAEDALNKLQQKICPEIASSLSERREMS